MSQLRKSASFRSRIPVRRNKSSQRRFCSPPSLTTSNNNIQTSSKKITNKNFQTTRIRSHNSLDSRKRYSSSSFSSSDESYESEAPHRRLIAQAGNNHQQHLQQHQQQHQHQQHHNHQTQNGYCTSTDAISLDGLLDSVSSGGSFSSPQRSLTPEKYQNTKMQNINKNNSNYDSLNKNSMKCENNNYQESQNHNNTNLIKNTSNLMMKNFEHCNQFQRRPSSSSTRKIIKRNQNYDIQENFIEKSLNNYCSDEDNSNIIENSCNKIISKNENSYSNVDLLTPLRSPRSLRHYQSRYNQHQQQRKILHENCGDDGDSEEEYNRKLKSYYHHHQHQLHSYSPSNQRRQQQHQQKLVNKTKLQASDVTTLNTGIILKNSPSGISSFSSPGLPLPRLPSSSSSSSPLSSIKVMSSTTTANHRQHFQHQHHSHHHNKFNRDHSERYSFKDNLNCTTNNTNSSNNKKIIHRRDDNLNLDKFKTKKIIRPSRKLENILAGNHSLTYDNNNDNSNNNNNINKLREIEDNDKKDNNGADDNESKNFPKELHLNHNKDADITTVQTNVATAVVISHKQNFEYHQEQQEQQQKSHHHHYHHKLKDNKKEIKEKETRESNFNEGKVKYLNWQNNNDVDDNNDDATEKSSEIMQQNNGNMWNRQCKDNSVKSSRSGGNLSLQKIKTQKRLGETSSSSFEHININDSNTRKMITTRSPSAERSIEENQFNSHLLISDFGQINLNRDYEMWREAAEEKVTTQMQNMIYPTPKTSSSYRSDCELSGSYISLECPSPPGPPTCLPESRRDPQARLSNYLKTLYIDLALKEPIIPPWAIPVAPGALCPARLEPELRLHSQSHGFNNTLTVDQLLSSIHTKEGTFLEAPRRILIECPSWTSRCNLSLRILHAWAKEPPWPPKGTPVALALFIPLNEIKRSLSNYVEKELLPKGPLNPFSSGFGGFSSAWNSLDALGPKLLILLDGYDTHRGTPKGRKGKHYPPDIHDLLDGKIFSHARVIITTSTTNNSELLPLIQRHVTYEGLTWGRSASLLGGGQWGAPTRLLDTVQECQHLRKIVRTPLGCLSIASIFEATAGDLPTDELDVIESVLNCVAPETTQNNIAELGRLALFCLKMKRPSITMSEIRMYCSTPDSSIMGCLDKELLLGKTARKKGEIFYNPMCPGMVEFLAANYIASLVNRPGLLAAEITGLSMGDELEPELLKVIKFAMGLLGSRAHILLSKLTPLWLTPQTIFSLALAGGNSDENLSALCDILGISKHPPISPLETKPIWVQIRSIPNELMGWGMALKSPSCTLKNLELIYQIEKHVLLDSRSAMEIFLDSLGCNESVSTLRISSLIENDVKDSEINYLANCVSKALLKPKIENFELALTLLEEDPPILKLQSVVTSLCRTIPRQTKLSSIVLDLGLSTSQLVQICSTLEKCPNVTRLSLPHLRCERGAVGALASLLTMRPLSFLALPSCWGARDDPPSSSGVSMGSGSGSSTGTSGLIKQGSLTGVPSPRSYPPGIFSSLPRGVFVPTTTMGRSATLPRQPMEPLADKRSSDSVVSKTWYPTPACEGGPHNSGTLHDLLLAAREPFSKLHGLDLSKAQLTLEDSMCLGETVRLSNTLHTLKLEGSSRLSEILPSVLGASESPSLQMLSIGSPRLNLEDPAISMSARSLTSCSTLRLLSLDGWSFRVENPSTLSIIRAFLSLTSIRELSLLNCRLQIGIFKSDTKIINAFESRSIVVLKLAGAQAILADSVILRGPQLLRFIGGFPCLRELDLSAPARSGFGTTCSSPLILDDKCLVNFFQSLHTYFSLLNTLKMCNWVIHFDDSTKTLKLLSKCIRNSPLSHLKLDGITVLDRQKKLRIESQLLHSFISSLPLLRWMGISLSGKKDDQITSIGNAVLDLKGYEIDIKLSESTIEQAKLMAQAISLDGKFDIKVSTFGTSSGILIHAEKSGAKSLNRKNKD